MLTKGCQDDPDRFGCFFLWEVLRDWTKASSSFLDTGSRTSNSRASRVRYQSRNDRSQAQPIHRRHLRARELAQESAIHREVTTLRASLFLSQGLERKVRLDLIALG